MESVYIIGGSGFIGKHLSVYLSKSYNVTIFDKWIDSAYFSCYPNVRCEVLDVISEQIPPTFVTPDYIINLAATLVTADRNLDNIDSLIADNIRIEKNLFKRFSNDNRLKLFVQFGSIEEYGNGQIPLTETQRELPNSAYALLKQATTNYAMLLYSKDGFPATVVRSGNLFGKGQNPQRFVPYVLNQLRVGEPLKVTPCEQKRDFIYIKDFVELIGEILNKSSNFAGEIVNVSSGISLRLKDIIDKMQSLLHSDSVVEYGALPYRDGEVMDLNCSVEKLEQLLGEKLNINPLNRIDDYIKETL